MSRVDDLKAIYTSAIEAVEPGNAIRNHLKLEGNELSLFVNNILRSRFDLSKFERVIVVGAGKATANMALAVEEILGPRIDAGLIVVKYGYTAPLSIIETREGGHPLPDESGFRATEELLGLLSSTTDKDLVISLISGGGSALLPAPPAPVTLHDKIATTNLLLKSGASIHEINTLRKHLSRVKGGQLARAASPATVLNLMISDVVGDTMASIASGPFVPDPATFKDAGEVIEKYALWDVLPDTVTGRIRAGINGDIEDTPDANDPLFGQVTNQIIASNIIALKAARDTAEELGYNTMILSSMIEGDTTEAARFHGAIAREIRLTSYPLSRPACVISGGETTVQIHGDGKGGRNTELALQLAHYLDGEEGIFAASVGTDGTDGPTDAAGAWITPATLQGREEAAMKAINNNDSYSFFHSAGSLIKTGPTNTNVMDCRVMLIV